MIPGIRVNVIADVARAAFPIGRIYVPAGAGHVALNLEWKDEKPVVLWMASPAPTDPFGRLLRDVMGQDESEAWRADADAMEPLTSTAAVHLLLPVAQRWLSQPVHRADDMIIWLRIELLLPQEVH